MASTTGSTGAITCAGCGRTCTGLVDLLGHIEKGQCRITVSRLMAVRDEDFKQMTVNPYGLDPEVYDQIMGGAGESELSRTRPTVKDTMQPVARFRAEVLASSVSLTDADKAYDPAAPGFNAQKFLHPILQKYKCGYRGCQASFKSKQPFIAHLNTAEGHPAKVGRAARSGGSADMVRYQCPSCFNKFNGLLAMAQHVESGGHCVLAGSGSGRAFVEWLSAGLVTIVLPEDETRAGSEAGSGRDEEDGQGWHQVRFAVPAKALSRFRPAGAVEAQIPAPAQQGNRPDHGPEDSWW